MSEEKITTPIESLIDYLYAHGETNSFVLATTFNVNEQVIGAWADALEAAKMIKVVYKFDQMFLSPIVETGNRDATLSNSMQVKKSDELKARFAEFRSYVMGLDVTMSNREEKLISKLKSMATPASASSTEISGQKNAVFETETEHE
jgi:hypothetical protein